MPTWPNDGTIGWGASDIDVSIPSDRRLRLRCQHQQINIAVTGTVDYRVDWRRDRPALIVFAANSMSSFQALKNTLQFAKRSETKWRSG